MLKGVYHSFSTNSNNKSPNDNITTKDCQGHILNKKVFIILEPFIKDPDMYKFSVLLAPSLNHSMKN